MIYDTFDTNFGMTPGFDSFNGGCVPPFSGGCGMGMPISNGYVFGDEIPFTPSTPPAWMTARAMQAEMHLNQLEAQLNDPNFWMNFIPKDAFNLQPFPQIDSFVFDYDAIPTDMAAPTETFDSGTPVALDPMEMMPEDNYGMSDFGMQDDGASTDSPLTWKGEDVLPCGLTQSAYDSILANYQTSLADCERQLAEIDPYHSAQRAMIQNNIDRINRSIRDLDKPLGKL